MYLTKDIMLNRNNNLTKIFGRFLFTFLIISTVFGASRHFNEPNLQIKYYSFIIGALLIIFFFIFQKHNIFFIRILKIDILLFITAAYFIVINVLSQITIHFLFLPLLPAYYFFYKSNRDNIFFDLFIVLACVFEAVWGIVQVSMSFPNISYNIPGSFDNTAGFASFLCLGFPFGLTLIKQKGIRKQIGLTGCIIIALAVLLTQSRAGILSLFFVMLAYGLLNFRILNGKRKKVLLFVFFLFIRHLFISHHNI